MGSFKKNGFSTHNNTIASYGCIKNMMQRMVEKIVCILYTNLWYCVNGIISSTAKSINFNTVASNLLYIISCS